MGRNTYGDVVYPVLLKSGSTFLACNLNRQVKVGDAITLTDEDNTLWDVRATYEPIRFADTGRGWNNNI